MDLWVLKRVYVMVMDVYDLRKPGHLVDQYFDHGGVRAVRNPILVVDC